MSTENSRAQFASDRANWAGADFGQNRSWVRHLDADMRREIKSELMEFKGRQASAEKRDTPQAAETPIPSANFSLPTTTPLLEKLRRDLDEGPGFGVIGGFPVDDYDATDTRTIYLAIAAKLGRVVVQTHRGERLIDVKDVGKPYSHRSRGYSSNKLLPFHTDGADVAGLLCLGVAETGGASVLVSAVRAYEILAQRHPELLETLIRGFYHHRRGEHRVDESPLSTTRIPVFQIIDNLLHAMYNRNPIEWARHEGIELSSSEISALDALDATLATPDLQLRMDMQKGDIQFINNFVIFHSRTGYRDSGSTRRHLLRVWLNLNSGRRRGPTLLDLYAPSQNGAN